MGKVTSEISMSLDGFITGPNVGAVMGWGTMGIAFTIGGSTRRRRPTPRSRMRSMPRPGRSCWGSGCSTSVFEPWGDPPPFGMPVFVVTHEAREPLPMQGGTTYTFVTDGIEAALELARAAAGDRTSASGAERTS